MSLGPERSLKRQEVLQEKFIANTNLIAKIKVKRVVEEVLVANVIKNDLV